MLAPRRSRNEDAPGGKVAARKPISYAPVRQPDRSELQRRGARLTPAEGGNAVNCSHGYNALRDRRVGSIIPSNWTGLHTVGARPTR